MTASVRRGIEPTNVIEKSLILHCVDVHWEIMGVRRAKWAIIHPPERRRSQPPCKDLRWLKRLDIGPTAAVRGGILAGELQVIDKMMHSLERRRDVILEQIEICLGDDVNGVQSMVMRQPEPSTP